MYNTTILLLIAVTVGLAVVGYAQAETRPASYFVATKGNDAWSGKLPKANKQRTDGPFATLERARDEIRKLKNAGALLKGGVTVELRGGVFQLERPFALTAEDSGTEESPVVYRASRGEEVRLVGGKVLTGWQPVTDPAVLERLDPSVRGKVFQTDLKAQGITDYGPVTGGGPELFFQDRPMTVARWPNEGFVHIVDLVGGAPHRIHGNPGDKIGKFVYEGDRPKRWIGEKDLWLHGYWFWDWADQRQKVESIDTEKRVISLVPPYHWYGYRKGQWYYAFNALAELDAPEEWYLDRETGTLYFLPPPPAVAQVANLRHVEDGKPMVSISPTLVTMKDTAHVTLRGMTLEATRATAITITGGTQNRVVGCVVRNAGSWAVTVSGGTSNGVVGCDIYNTGDGGITLDGGDRRALTPAGHFAVNNHLHHFSRINPICRPGIGIYGVGTRAAHNLFDNAPHIAIMFGGNDHTIEFNEFHSVVYQANDAGVIYAGRNWTMRGTVIRYNYFHHINGFQGRGCVGVYLDDQYCGTLVYGNVFYKVTRAAMIGGGRDCTIENNIFVDCVPATHVDARGLGWAASGFEGLKNDLLSLPYREKPWSDRYPQLVNILDDDPMAPKGNLIARNICVGGRWGDFEAKAKPMVRFEDNLLDQDPLFVDAAHENFQLKQDSPAFKLGFKRIPIEQIGLLNDGTRASWPVTHRVRPMVEAPAVKRAARTGPLPVFRVARATASIVVDGVITPKEWSGADPAKAMVLEQGLEGDKVSPRSLAWIAYDDSCLLVAVDNAVDPNQPITRGNQWGQDDAVEIAVRNTAAGKEAPLLVLRGYPNGHFESSDEAGAPAPAVKRATQGVEYKAKIVAAGRWTCEWCLPFASLGIDPAKHTKLAFNLSVRKMAQPLWVLWQGTRAATWEVGNAGFIELAR